MSFIIYWSCLCFSFIPFSHGVEDLCSGVVCNGPNLPKKYCEDGSCKCYNGALTFDCIEPPTSTISTEVKTHKLPRTAITTAAAACVNNPCKEDCTCVPSCQHEDGYYCESPSGYIGKNCNIAVPLLTCSRDRITISIKKEFLHGVYASEHVEQACFYISPQPSFSHSESCQVCSSQDGVNYNLFLDLPFNKCGTSVENYTENNMTVTNLVWANVYTNDYDVPIPVMQFRCNYTNDFIVVANLKPTIAKQFASLQKFVSLKANIELCKVGSSCPAKCPAVYSVSSAAVYTVSETIHVTMSVDENSVATFRSSFIGEPVVVVETMELSCDSSKSYNSIALVSSGCATSDLSTRLNMNKFSNVVCMSFKVPRLRDCRGSFYIHAKLRVVDSAVHTLNCNSRREPMRNSQNSMRGKRSLEQDIQDGKKLTADLSLGPIFVLKLSDGQSSSSIFPMKNDPSFVPSTVQPTTDDPLIPEAITLVTEVLFGTLGAAVSLIFIMMCAIHYRRCRCTRAST